MIVVITCWDTPRNSRGEPTGEKPIQYVSHGVDYDTDRNVCLPCEPISRFLQLYGKNMFFATDIGEWVMQ
jgi:hypothetical protein